MNLKYTQFKMFHYKDKLDSLPQNINLIKPPLHIRIKPTNSCAHNCWYCSYRSENMQLGKNMDKRDYIPKKKMLEIMDDIVEMGVGAVTFSGGGDPFYYPFLLDAVKKLINTPVQFASLHNGARLDGERAEIFAHHATWLRISIDGWDDESYAKNRGIKRGEFLKVMKNMENFKKLGGSCPLGISLIIDKSNAEHVYEFSRQLKDIGVDSIKMSACVVHDDASTNDQYHDKMFQTVRLQIQKVIDELSDDGFEVYDAYHELDTRFKKGYSWCPYIQLNPVIGADLNVYSCHDKAYNLEEGVIGSIKDSSFKELWSEDKENFFRIDPQVHCNHHCMVNAKNKMIIEYLDTDKEHMAFV